MAVKIHGHYVTPGSRRILVIAKECNIPYEFVPVDLRGKEHQRLPYIEHQPFGQVPYIEHDGFELFESRAIGRYFAALGSGIEYAQFDPIAGKIFRETLYKKSHGQPIDEESVKELLPVLESKLDVYEAILSKQKYLAGDEVTLADLFHLPHGSTVFDHFGYGGLDKRPNVQRWWKAISSRPAWRAVKEL
ncbi:glutathione S-transferase [Russula brevipes]|nr:glutathione S-transferase [Russula brevipes]